MNGNLDLKINEDVLAKMASVAATEVEGVYAISTKVTNIKDVATRFGRGVKASVASDGEITLEVYISVKEGVNIRDVAAHVQQNVKDKVQNMTGSAVSRINVHIADVEFEKPEEAAQVTEG